jgi:hypothetical protein
MDGIALLSVGRTLGDRKLAKPSSARADLFFDFLNLSTQALKVFENQKTR